MNHRLVAFLCLWLATFATFENRAALSIAISPASQPRDFEGELTYTMGGFAPGLTVQVDRFADNNGNGVIDANDTLVRHFKITDGQSQRFNGVANHNVPGDDDGLGNGSIISSMPVGIDQIINRQAGKYLVRATAGENSAVAPFEIVAPEFPQRVSGLVKNAANNNPVPFAWVVVLVGDGMPVGSVRADASGQYTAPAPPGDYILLPFADEFIASFQQVSLAAGQTLDQPLSLTPATQRISGRVSTLAGAGVPAIFVLGEARSGNSDLIAGALTDSAGNYSFAVTDGSWEFQVMTEFASQIGLLTPKDATPLNVTGPATVNFALPQATALIHGRVADASGAPVANLPFYAQSQSNPRLEASGRTSALGDYYLAVGAGTWEVNSDGSGSFGLQKASALIAIGENESLLQNFTLARLTAQLSGRVIQSNGSGFGDLELVAFQENGGGNSEEVGDDGSFAIHLTPGHWKLQVAGSAPSGFLAPALEFDLADGQQIENIQFVLLPVDTTISGFVRTPAGVPLGGIVIRPSATIGGVHYFAEPVISLADGSYAAQVGRANWFMNLDCFKLQLRYLQCPNTPPVDTSGGNANANITISRLVGPKIEAPILVNSGDFRFTLRGDPGTYQIYGATEANADSGSWTFVGTATINDQRVGQGLVNPDDNRFFQARRE
jgi:hypothetical protein